MPKLDLTQDEITMLMNAMNTEIKSAKRSQNSGKTPQIKQIYYQHERTLAALCDKIASAK